MSGGDTTVVVTGLGAFTPLGTTVKETWTALLDGRSAVAKLDEPWAARLPVRLAARAAADPAELLGRVPARRLDRVGQFGVLAVREAWADAGFVEPAGAHGGPDPDRVAVVLGTGVGGVHTIVDNHEQLRNHGPRKVSPLALPMLMNNHAAAQAALEIGARAQATAPSTACAAGAEAVAAGLDLIRLGRADVVAVGGTDAGVHPLIVAGFAQMRALSARNDEPGRASRPFDHARDGFVLAEGAAVLILERASHAEARGVRGYCTLAGAGLSSEAHHITSPHPDGAGMASAMRRMLSDARLEAGDVGHVHAHATSTGGGDVAESRAIGSVLGLGTVPVSAIKSMTGHLLGAAGALGAVASVLTLVNRVAPPTANLDDLDDRIDVDVVGTFPRELPAAPRAAVCNAAGFGGHNVSLAFTPHP
ncbi:beta-ketoacyl-[acyl-carrier-protein] synthase family protein [Streptomyces sp. MN03-5084-2B]|nr:beta-ketoacyl-[acyl-carrier-protein] synthase family protein [Streptomyces sp. MN03-5084-2B]